jgi:membrane-associated protein
MNYRRFVTYNIVGGLLWACGVTLAGYFLGNLIPDVDKYLLPIIVLIVLVSVLPSAIHLLRDDETRADIMNLGRRVLRMAPAKEKNKPSDIA